MIESEFPRVVVSATLLHRSASHRTSFLASFASLRIKRFIVAALRLRRLSRVPRPTDLTKYFLLVHRYVQKGIECARTKSLGDRWNLGDEIEKTRGLRLLLSYDVLYFREISFIA